MARRIATPPAVPPRLYSAQELRSRTAESFANGILVGALIVAIGLAPILSLLVAAHA